MSIVGKRYWWKHWDDTFEVVIVLEVNHNTGDVLVLCEDNVAVILGADEIQDDCTELSSLVFTN